MAGLHVETLPWLQAREIAVLGSDAASDVTPVPVDGLGSAPGQFFVRAVERVSGLECDHVAVPQR